MFNSRSKMKKLLLGLAVIFPVQLLAADDSVYSWGAWAEGIKPAAGPVANIAPAPAQKPQVQFRPNENSAFARNFVPINATPAAPVGGANQLPNIVTVPPGTGLANPSGLTAGTTQIN